MSVRAAAAASIVVCGVNDVCCRERVALRITRARCSNSDDDDSVDARTTAYRACHCAAVIHVALFAAYARPPTPSLSMRCCTALRICLRATMMALPASMIISQCLETSVVHVIFVIINVARHRATYPCRTCRYLPAHTYARL